jgi:hypothetical protein
MRCWRGYIGGAILHVLLSEFLAMKKPATPPSRVNDDANDVARVTAMLDAGIASLKAGRIVTAAEVRKKVERIFSEHASKKKAKASPRRRVV